MFCGFYHIVRCHRAGCEGGWGTETGRANVVRRVNLIYKLVAKKPCAGRGEGRKEEGLNNLNYVGAYEGKGGRKGGEAVV